MQTPLERDLTGLRQGLTGHIPEPKIATEIVCSRTSSQLRQIKQAYNSTYCIPLDHDVGAHTSGNHRQVLYSIISLTLLIFIVSIITSLL